MTPETKRDKFLRLAENRVNKVLDDLRILGHCGNRSNYDYTDEDVRIIFAKLEKGLRETKGQFLGIEMPKDRITLRKKKKTAYIG